MSARSYALALVLTGSFLVLILGQLRNQRVRAKYAMLWLAATAVTVPLGVVPGLLDRLADAVGVAYGPALLLVLGLAYFALLNLQLSIDLHKVEERTRVLAEEVAILRSMAIGPSAYAPDPPATRTVNGR